MIRIRRVYNTATQTNRHRVEQVKEIYRQSFSADAAYAEKIAEQLNQPFKHGYRAILIIAEMALGKVMGFSLFFHFPEINSAFLDFLVVRSNTRGGGLGSALYEATREYLHATGARALYLEAMPDDPETAHSPEKLEENRQRLRFYEHYDARPIIGTEYETPIGDSTSAAPHLLYDGLGRDEPLRRAECRAAVRLILQRKYGHLAKRDYIERVVESIIDNPVRIAAPRYVKHEPPKQKVASGILLKPFALISCEGHRIHHVKERGYVERPVRVDVLQEALHGTDLFNPVTPRHFGEKHIRAVHDADFVQYLQAVCRTLSGPRPVYPYVFPIRRPERRPKELAVRAGYYCIDTFTPLDRNAYEAARAAVDVALSAAEEVLRGRRMAYALCRPPGHHAERRVFGGFCYFNNAAIAAHRLSQEGKVAVLDIDFHHGNGTQDIFWRRSDVLTLSVHGHPNYAYPYFSGFADETGEGDGKGFNRNYPLSEGTDEDTYLVTLEKAAERIRRFNPDMLVVSLGFDIMKGDPTGAFKLTARSMEKVGRFLGEMGLPTLVVQEGGYSLRNLRRGATAFFRGMAKCVEK